jgi:hypothetical protein
MRTLPTLLALLVTTLSIAACGASEPQQSGQAAPSRETQATPAPQSAPKESTPQGNAPRESAQDGEGGEAVGLSVTTIEGEQVNLGGQGDVTALYFMAGW